MRSPADRLARSLTLRLAIVLVAFGALVLAVLLMAQSRLGDDPAANAELERAQAQRVRTSIIAVSAGGAIHAPNPAVRAEARRGLVMATRNLRRDHAAIAGAGDLTPTAQRILFESPHRLDARARRFLSSADRLIDSPIAQPGAGVTPVPNPLVQDISAQATSGPLDAALRDLERDVRDNTTETSGLAALAPIALGGGLAVLLLGFLLLGPGARQVRRQGERLQRHADVQGARRRIGEAVAHEQPSAEVFALTAREAGEALGLEAVVVTRVDGDHLEVVGSWACDGLPSPSLGSSVPLESDLPGPRAVREGIPQRQTSLEGSPWTAMSDAYVAAAAVPLAPEGSDKPWGALVAAWTEGGSVDAEQLDALKELAATLAPSLEAVFGGNVVARAVAAILADEHDLDSMLGAITQAAQTAVGCDRATFYVNTPNGRRLEALHTTEQDPERRRFLQKAIGKGRDELPLWDYLLSAEDAMLVIEDVEHDPAIPDNLRRGLGAGAFIGVRLEHAALGDDGDATLLGTLFMSYSSARRIGVRQRSATRSLAGIATMALANARLHEKTLDLLEAERRRASTDELTGLMNHATFQQTLAREVRRARDLDLPLALAVLDLDHFKRVNDNHGHQVGDEVLREAARRITTGVRSEDVIARVGGEEFAWLMPGTEGYGAWQAAERVRAVLRSAPFAEIGTVTVSIGICDMQPHTVEPDELYRLADGALYWAKNHGRDQVVTYSPEEVEVLSDAHQAERLGREQSLQAMRVLARAVDAKDPSMRRHSERVADLAVQISSALNWPMQRRVMLREAGLVHDVGKIAVPDDILGKPGQLDHQEFARIRTHATIGGEIVSDVLPEEQCGWVRHHHERWDGAGYPEGLAGAEVPDGALILGLADAWDVMTSDRPYCGARPPDDALAEVLRCSGAQFWPDAVAALEILFHADALPVPDSDEVGDSPVPERRRR